MSAEAIQAPRDATHLFYSRVRSLVVQAGAINRAQLDELYRRFRQAVERGDLTLAPASSSVVSRQADAMASARSGWEGVGHPTASATPARLGAASPPAGVRRNHLLRLLTAAYAPMFEAPGPGQLWEPLPRRIVGGVQNWLEYALGPQLLAHMNEFAGTILEDIDTADDVALWKAATTHPGYGVLVRDILVRLAFKFEDYETARGKLLTIMINALREQNRQSWLTDGQGDQLLSAIFRPLKSALNQNRERIRIDFMLGDGTATRLATILDRIVPTREGEISAVEASRAA